MMQVIKWTDFSDIKGNPMKRGFSDSLAAWYSMRRKWAQKSSERPASSWIILDQPRLYELTDLQNNSQAIRSTL